VQVAISGDDGAKIVENVGANVLIQYIPQSEIMEDMVNVSGKIELMSESAEYMVFNLTSTLTFSAYVLVNADGTGYYEFSCPNSWSGGVEIRVVESVDEVARMSDINEKIGDIDSALDELHAYAQAIVSGGEA
jgi:hypothetical protein